MRVLAFSKLYPKLAKPTFTTFRYTKREAGETVQVVFDEDGPMQSVLGIAEVVKCQPRCVEPSRRYCDCGIRKVSKSDAQVDGFKDPYALQAWWTNTYRHREDYPNYHMHRIHYAWQQIHLFTPEQHEDVAKEWAALIGRSSLGSEARPHGMQYILRQDILTAIHNVAALGNTQ